MEYVFRKEPELAIEFDLYLATHMKPVHALELLSNRFTGLSWSEDRLFLGDEVVSICSGEVLKSRREALKEGYGFTPTLGIHFRRVFDAEHEQFYQFLMTATLVLLEYTQDAVLLFNGELTVMQRLGGRIAFNAEKNPGRDEAWLRSRFPLPFECRSLRSPLVEG